MTLKPTILHWMMWMLLWAVAAFGLYMVKYQVQAKRLEVAKAERQLRAEEKNLHVLAAEWAYLTRPDRLRRLAAEYTNATPVNSKQVVNYAALAYSPVAMAHHHNSPTVAVTLASGALHAR